MDSPEPAAGVVVVAAGVVALTPAGGTEILLGSGAAARAAGVTSVGKLAASQDSPEPAAGVVVVAPENTEVGGGVTSAGQLAASHAS